MKPQRTFTADVGQWSVDNAGPDAIERDFDNVNKMFDPESTFPGGEKGGIKAENLSAELNGLAGSGDSSLHYHSSDRKRENHTGTQAASTISDFAVAVRNTVLTGLSTAANRVITATDSILTSLGLLQKQITDLDAAAVHKTGNETISGVKTLSSSPIVPYPASDAQAASKKYVDDVAAPKANASDVYTKSNLQTSGQSAVHWSNLTNVPNFGDPHWKPPVANRAALPLTGNALQDTRTVLDDGDGKQAIYNCVATAGTVNQQWAKVADVDWMADEATRATQEAARVTAENGRISAESARATAEGNRVSAENVRVSAEGARVSAENGRSSEEVSRVGFENTRRSSEISRNSAENLRVSAESTRQTNETNRGNAESVRVAIESTRQTNETARSNAESTRQSNEVIRQTNEANRGTAENDRVTAENTRVLAENNRVAAENARAVFEAYNAETAYVVGNKVSYEGASYTCIANSTGNPPTNEGYWLCIVAGVLASGSNVLLTGYGKPEAGGSVEATDTVNQAVGKLEKRIDGTDAEVGSLDAELSILGESKQDKLVSGTNIKTILDKSLIGSGNVVMDGTDIVLTGYALPEAGGSVEATDTVNQAVGKLETNSKEYIKKGKNPPSTEGFVIETGEKTASNNFIGHRIASKYSEGNSLRINTYRENSDTLEQEEGAYARIDFIGAYLEKGNHGVYVHGDHYDTISDASSNLYLTDDRAVLEYANSVHKEDKSMVYLSFEEPDPDFPGGGSMARMSTRTFDDISRRSYNEEVSLGNGLINISSYSYPYGGSPENGFVGDNLVEVTPEHIFSRVSSRIWDGEKSVSTLFCTELTATSFKVGSEFDEDENFIGKDVLTEGGAGLLAERPITGIIGQVYVSTDEAEGERIYMWSGTQWITLNS